MIKSLKSSLFYLILQFDESGLGGGNGNNSQNNRNLILYLKLLFYVDCAITILIVLITFAFLIIFVIFKIKQKKSKRAHKKIKEKKISQENGEKSTNSDTDGIQNQLPRTDNPEISNQSIIEQKGRDSQILTVTQESYFIGYFKARKDPDTSCIYFDEDPSCDGPYKLYNDGTIDISKRFDNGKTRSKSFYKNYFINDVFDFNVQGLNSFKIIELKNYAEFDVYNNKFTLIRKGYLIIDR